MVNENNDTSFQANPQPCTSAEDLTQGNPQPSTSGEVVGKEKRKRKRRAQDEAPEWLEKYKSKLMAQMKEKHHSNSIKIY